MPAGGRPTALSQRRGSDSSFYQTDGIKNVRQLTDASQVVTDEYDFDAWGSSTSATGSTLNSQQYKGELLAYRKDPDAAPDIQYALHHRNYDPKSGRFTGADPIESDLNLYRYVSNNPVNSDAPSGLEPPYTLSSLNADVESGRFEDIEQIDVMELSLTIKMLSDKIDEMSYWQLRRDCLDAYDRAGMPSLA